MTYDNEGRFRPQNFEDVFAKYDRDNKGGLTWGDLWHFWRGQAMVLDLFGINATILECEWSPDKMANITNRGDRDCGVFVDLARGRNHEEGRHSGCL